MQVGGNVADGRVLLHRRRLEPRQPRRRRPAVDHPPRRRAVQPRRLEALDGVRLHGRDPAFEPRGVGRALLARELVLEPIQERRVGARVTLLRDRGRGGDAAARRGGRAPTAPAERRIGAAGLHTAVEGRRVVPRPQLADRLPPLARREGEVRVWHAPRVWALRDRLEQPECPVGDARVDHLHMRLRWRRRSRRRGGRRPRRGGGVRRWRWRRRRAQRRAEAQSQRRCS